MSFGRVGFPKRPLRWAGLGAKFLPRDVGRFGKACLFSVALHFCSWKVLPIFHPGDVLSRGSAGASPYRFVLSSEAAF
jgi:hypothetical protein